MTAIRPTGADRPPRTRPVPDRRGRAGASPSARCRELDRLERLGTLLDARFRLPGTDIRFGLDGLVGLVPGVGDTLAAAPSAYVIVQGWRLGARKRVLARMAGNTLVDGVVGAMPVLGDIFDIGFKANLRNIALLQRELGGAGARP